MHICDSETLPVGLGGVQLKYISIDNNDDVHARKRSGHVTRNDSEIVVEDLEDCDMDTLCSQSDLLSRPNRRQSDQSRTAFENPFAMAQTEGEIQFYNEGIDMTVFSNSYTNDDNAQTENSHSKTAALTKQDRNIAPKQLTALRTGNQKQGSPRGHGHSQRSRPVNPNIDLVREASFVSDSASSGYYSESQPGGEFSERHHPHRESMTSQFSERHHPYRESITSEFSERRQPCRESVHSEFSERHQPCRESTTSEFSQRDFSAFVTQSDRERISNRGRDMTVYMYVLGGKESRSQNVTVKPINMWKLHIY